MTIIAEPQTLRAFVAVEREGNVSRAAQRLHLKRLAQSTGLVLFNRTPRDWHSSRTTRRCCPRRWKWRRGEAGPGICCDAI
jgi:hypothetical protein